MRLAMMFQCSRSPRIARSSDLASTSEKWHDLEAVWIVRDAAGEWRSRALCRNLPPELWFPPGDGKPSGARPREDVTVTIEDAEAAVQICHQCPVEQECLAYALANGERDGVWGGMLEADRRALMPRKRYA
jgi:WhiB family redox-sensing transcriptional regulator